MNVFGSIRLMLASVLALLLMAPAVGAQTTIIAPPGSGFPYQDWINETTRVPTPDATITVVEFVDWRVACESQGLGCTDGQTMIGIAGWLPTPRYTFFHELGHFFALHHPELAGFEDERFADIYSLCARLQVLRLEASYSAGEGLIPGSRLNRLCGVIRAG